MDISATPPYDAHGRLLNELDYARQVHFCPQSLLSQPPTLWARDIGLFPTDPESKTSGPSPATHKELYMGKKLYIGNMSYEMDSSSLQELFAAHGTVESAEVIADRDTGRSKGFGFVEMSSDAEAQAGIAALNGKDHGGRRDNR